MDALSNQFHPSLWTYWFIFFLFFSFFLVHSFHFDVSHFTKWILCRTNANSDHPLNRYSLKVECGVASNLHKSTMPDACFFFADNLVVVDHSNNDVYILSLENIDRPGSTESGQRANSNSWLDGTEKQLLGLKATSSTKSKDQNPSTATSTPCMEAFVVDKSKDQYMKDVEKCLEYIKDGESYELCLTTQMRKRVEEIDPVGLYLKLREKNPAPYAAWLNFSKENLSICCSSPERFLRLDGDGILEAKPIKGTIARGTTPEEDKQLRLQLQHRYKNIISHKILICYKNI